MKKVKVLITGGKMPGFASIARALKQSTLYDIEIIAGCWKESHSANFISDKTVPLADNKTRMFIASVFNALEKYKPEIIIPIRTDDLIPLANNLKWLRQRGCEICLPTTDPDLIYTANDKFLLLEYIRKIINYCTSEYFKVSNKEELLNALDYFKYPNNPVVVKPLFTGGSRGLRIIDEKYNYAYYFYADKPNNTHTKLSWLLDQLGDKFSPLLVTNYYPGREYTLDVLCRKGDTFAVVPRLRERMRDGITAEATVTDHDYHALRPICEKIVEGFGFSYNIGVQVKADKSGVFQLLEVNTRLQGTTCISVAAGVNIPEQMVAMALGEFDYDYKPKIRWGTQLERIYHEYYAYKGEITNG